MQWLDEFIRPLPVEIVRRNFEHQRLALVWGIQILYFVQRKISATVVHVRREGVDEHVGRKLVGARFFVVQGVCSQADVFAVEDFSLDDVWRFFVCPNEAQLRQVGFFFFAGWRVVHLEKEVVVGWQFECKAGRVGARIEWVARDVVADLLDLVAGQAIEFQQHLIRVERLVRAASDDGTHVMDDRFVSRPQFDRLDVTIFCENWLRPGSIDIRRHDLWGRGKARAFGKRDRACRWPTPLRQATRLSRGHPRRYRQGSLVQPKLERGRSRRRLVERRPGNRPCHCAGRCWRARGASNGFRCG